MLLEHCCNKCRWDVVIEQQVLYAQLRCTVKQRQSGSEDETYSNQSEQAFTSIISSPFCLSVSGLPLAKASCTFSPVRRIWSVVSASRACMATACLPTCLVRRCILLCDFEEKLASRWQAHGRRLQTGKLESLRTASVVCISSVGGGTPSLGKCTRDTEREC